jgi:hypothetical protein
LAERWPTKAAAEWREFWRERGMRELSRVLQQSWPPLEAASVEERESCAFRVASLLGSRAPRGTLAEELGRVRHDFGLPADTDEDERSAVAITSWFTSAAA